MTKQDIAKNVSSNTWVDKVLAGASAAVMLVATFIQSLDYIKAERPMNYAIAGLLIVFLLYLLLAPIFRSSK